MNTPIPAPVGIPAQDEPFGSGVRIGAGEEVQSPSPAPNASPDYMPPDYVPVAAMEAMLALRHQQIHTHGHTPEADRQQPLQHFAKELENTARAILESVQFNKPLDLTRRRTVKLGALAMALIDRIDAEGGSNV
jgi:hypothetical protein